MQPYDLEKIKRGVTKHRELKVVVTRLLDEVHKSNELKERYVRGSKNMSVLTDIFFKICHIFKNMPSHEI